MTYSSHHHTFTIDRLIDAPPALAFFAWANADAKAQWFAAPSAWTALERHFDFREGGSERLKGRWENGTISDFQCQYHDVVQDKRIVYTYDMFVNDKRISVSLATLEFTAEGNKTRLLLTEQIAHLDGYPTPEDREVGTRHLLDKAAAFIESQVVKA